MAKSVNAILMVLAAVLLVPAASYAAGLGTITVRSALGQPLDAEIEVVSAQPGEDIQVRLASREAYQNAGIDLSPALQGARFAVERRDGKTVIRVRTSQPVNDPFFSVLVELQSPTGRLSRQYTVLVDPAEYRVASAPAAQQAAAPAGVSPSPATPPARAQAAAPKVTTGKAPTAAPSPIATAPVVVAPPAYVAPASASAQAPSPVVTSAPAAASAPASAPKNASQSVVGPSVAERPIELAREPSPAPAVQPLVISQPTVTSAPIAPAPVVSETPRPAVVAAQPTPAAVQTPAVAAAPALADASAAAATKTAEPAPVKSSVEPVPVASATPQALVQQNSEVSDVYRIRRGDTLGAIARKRKPEGVSYEQMLIGLYQTNRDVFIRDNINLIRAGVTLFIPSRDDVLAISAADAARQVRTHMAAFTKYRDTTVTAGAGSGRISQAQREVISTRRVGAKKSTRSM
jgi:FimV-like protein